MESVLITRCEGPSHYRVLENCQKYQRSCFTEITAVVWRSFSNTWYNSINTSWRNYCAWMNGWSVKKEHRVSVLKATVWKNIQFYFGAGLEAVIGRFYYTVTSKNCQRDRVCFTSQWTLLLLLDTLLVLFNSWTLLFSFTLQQVIALLYFMNRYGLILQLWTVMCLF